MYLCMLCNKEPIIPQLCAYLCHEITHYSPPSSSSCVCMYVCMYVYMYVTEVCVNLFVRVDAVPAEQFGRRGQPALARHGEAIGGAEAARGGRNNRIGYYRIENTSYIHLTQIQNTNKTPIHTYIHTQSLSIIARHYLLGINRRKLYISFCSIMHSVPHY